MDFIAIFNRLSNKSIFSLRRSTHIIFFIADLFIAKINIMNMSLQKKYGILGEGYKTRSDIKAPFFKRNYFQA